MDASNTKLEDPADCVCNPDSDALNAACLEVARQKGLVPYVEVEPFRGSGCGDPDCDICV